MAFKPLQFTPGGHIPLDAGGSQRWWVAAKDFGTGPFRWVVTQGQDGPVVGSSESFDLPDEANETVQVSLTF